ncbi:hypothetical protein [Streptomyces sp. DSM 15324]|uniref:hypothetical protein n=1 Tax=Streptomyces sp. DSM 15324 TaxID=1739111 RepID=UPI00074778D3|nr:hypothetical protein [Streptomyces sp. DSM 15324]KUO12944.1 hypothetical protein AQJ58_07040 [Streptomyces sp. DSM 15324]
MGVDQLPGRVGEFANYLNGLLARLDQGAGWCAVFWQRDPDGMQACLDGREMPPWDVVEAVLQDLAAVYGTPAAAREAEHARSLHTAALIAYDARPGGREALGDRLDVMLREQRYAAERQAELGRLLGTAATQEDAEAIRLDLAWAHDDHERAVARCAELRHRMAEWERRAGEGRITDAHAVRRPSTVYGPTSSYGGSGSGSGNESGAGAPGHGTQADASRPDPWRGGEVTAGPGGPTGETGAEPSPEAHLRPAPVPAPGDHGRGEAGEASGGRLYDETAPTLGSRLRAEAVRTSGDDAPGETARFSEGHLRGEAVSGAGGDLRGEAVRFSEGHHLRGEAVSAPGYVRDGTLSAPDPSGYGAGAAVASPAPARHGEPSAGTDRGVAGPAAGVSAGPTSAAPSERGLAGPAGADPGSDEDAGPAGDVSGRDAAGPEKGAKQKRRRRGGARFAGMAQEEDASVAVPPSAGPVAPEPPSAARRTLRGARFAGAAARAERREEPQREPLDAEARGETVRAVEQLVALRAEGRSGEAHALLVELAYWPAARIPLLAAELRRAGLGADWTTLLWEAASLPADRLVEAADALVAVGRTADGEQLLRQGVARPAEEIGQAVLGLHRGGRRREARALLDAYVRVRPPEEAARGAAPDPQALVPLLLEAARGVSEQRRWDLVHALRVAGFSA